MYPAAPVIAFQVTVMVFSEAAFVAVSDVFAGPSVRTVTLFFEVFVPREAEAALVATTDKTKSVPEIRASLYTCGCEITYLIILFVSLAPVVAATFVASIVTLFPIAVPLLSNNETVYDSACCTSLHVTAIES